MDADVQTPASLRSGRRYEIHLCEAPDGWLVVDASRRPAIAIDLNGGARTEADDWTWRVTKERLAWRLIIHSAQRANREVLRIAPRGEIVKYRMTANGNPVCKLRQNPITQRWRLYDGTESFARIKVDYRYFGGSGLVNHDPVVGSLELGSRLPGEPTRSACLIAALLCIRFDASYADVGGAGAGGP